MYFKSGKSCIHVFNTHLYCLTSEKVYFTTSITMNVLKIINDSEIFVSNITYYKIMMFFTCPPVSLFVIPFKAILCLLNLQF